MLFIKESYPALLLLQLGDGAVAPPTQEGEAGPNLLVVDAGAADVAEGDCWEGSRNAGTLSNAVDIGQISDYECNFHQISIN